MLFKYPEVLYALFLLLIPIFIHLFQLRRFQRVEFTNVAFLRKVTIQTRKSSTIKKWLILLMRLFALACIIIAFAQPFTASKTALNSKKETVIYIDNSFSMQAKGSSGSLLDRAVQDLFDKAGQTEKLTWFSNDSERLNSSSQDFKNEILAVGYSQNQLAPSQVLMKADQLFSQEKDVLKQLIFISDFQQKEAFPDISQNIKVDAVQVAPVKATNITIDSVFVVSKNATTTQLQVNVSKQGDAISEVPISLFNNGKLTAKTAVDLSQNSTGTITFDIDASETFNGKLELSEVNMPFDNSLFFSINRPEKIKVLAINGADGNFLQRLFEKERFLFKQQTFKTLDYNQIPDQNFIVLNQLQDIPNSLATALKSFSDAGGSVLIIPSRDAVLNSYNSFLAMMNIGVFSEALQQEKKITKIVFSHPLFQGVFEKEVVNFQYPKVNSIYGIKTTAAPALIFEDLRPFLLQKDKTYLFTAAIDTENSNFINSPLVVPTIYNMGLQSLPLPNLYYVIGGQNTFGVPVQLGPDQILAMKDSISQFIPRQQTKANHVLITTIDEPKKAGSYELVRDNEVLQTVSYNYSRNESKLNYLNAADWEGANLHNSINDLFDSLSEANAINSFWKWFVIFALFFLLCEMLILKFLK
ncbi:BatA domain-containing protein [Aequorivita viscosa]|uniref:N-terminal double-transmembrane domain-containing protein n=1 Tax=Aequorivita viscosa TaxID=797419 RepID=A0A1M6GCK8_9FLAO|nr:BatA domain-containing protein [Aequorivita viscosa]SDW86053.1 N-terminal double-transmembrane domain-containing protein [Aequorivita viscosa]SHJ07650.1 N-terminal double-transmembrane domain-containing protein [Aequorivita viscosa]